MDMRTKIAQAIWLAADKDWLVTDHPEDCAKLADAVLDTLMEPDEGMIEAGDRAAEVSCYCHGEEEASFSIDGSKQVWTAMLTHARSPTEEKK